MSQEAALLRGQLQVERLDNGKRMLLRDLVIDLRVDLGLGNAHEGFTVSIHGHTIVTVPMGFETDFSSVPGLARALYRFDSVDLAGCCHDWAYHVGVPQAKADEVWWLVAISGHQKVSRFKGRLGWLGLRLFGRFAYADHRRRREQRDTEAAAATPSTAAPRAA